MAGLGTEALAFLEGFAIQHAVGLGGIVAAIIMGHGVGKALAGIIRAFGDALADRITGGRNGTSGGGERRQWLDSFDMSQRRNKPRRWLRGIVP